MKEGIKKRLTSPVVWGTIVTNLSVILGVLVNEACSTRTKIIGTAIIAIATSIGALNNPSDKENF